MSKRKLVFTILWLVDILIMVFIILFPKNESVLQSMYFVFLVCIFVVPGLLLLFQCFQRIKYKDGVAGELLISGVGCSFLMSLTFIKFVSSIKKEFVWQMIFILLVFVLLEWLLGYISLSIKDEQNKKLVSCSTAIYSSLVLFYFVAMIMSYDHSIIW